MKNKIWYLHGQKFLLIFLFRKNFWKFIYFAIIAKFGFVTIMKSGMYKNTFYTFGTKEPIEEFWNKGYKVKIVGYILGEMVLSHSKE